MLRSSPSPVGSRWATWANALTAARFLLIVPCAALVLTEHWAAAGVMLTAAIATDLLDGAVARRLNQISALGGTLDHSVDAAFVSVLLMALAWHGLVPWPLAPLVLAAFLQYLLDSRALAGRPLRGSRLGRVNGIAYYGLVAVAVYRNALGLAWPGDALIGAAGWVLISSTLASMLLRLRRASGE